MLGSQSISRSRIAEDVGCARHVARITVRQLLGSFRGQLLDSAEQVNLVVQKLVLRQAKALSAQQQMQQSLQDAGEALAATRAENEQLKQQNRNLQLQVTLGQQRELRLQHQIQQNALQLQLVVDHGKRLESTMKIQHGFVSGSVESLSERVQCVEKLLPRVQPLAQEAEKAKQYGKKARAAFALLRSLDVAALNAPLRRLQTDAESRLAQIGEKLQNLEPAVKALQKRERARDEERRAVANSVRSFSGAACARLEEFSDACRERAVGVSEKSASSVRRAFWKGAKETGERVKNALADQQKQGAADGRCVQIAGRLASIEADFQTCVCSEAKRRSQIKNLLEEQLLRSHAGFAGSLTNQIGRLTALNRRIQKVYAQTARLHSRREEEQASCLLAAQQTRRWAQGMAAGALFLAEAAEEKAGAVRRRLAAAADRQGQIRALCAQQAQKAAARVAWAAAEQNKAFLEPQKRLETISARLRTMEEKVAICQAGVAAGKQENERRRAVEAQRIAEEEARRKTEVRAAMAAAQELRFLLLHTREEIDKCTGRIGTVSGAVHASEEALEKIRAQYALLAAERKRERAAIQHVTLSMREELLGTFSALPKHMARLEAAAQLLQQQEPRVAQAQAQAFAKVRRLVVREVVAFQSDAQQHSVAVSSAVSSRVKEIADRTNAVSQRAQAKAGTALEAYKYTMVGKNALVSLQATAAAIKALSKQQETLVYAQLKSLGARIGVLERPLLKASQSVRAARFAATVFKIQSEQHIALTEEKLVALNVKRLVQAPEKIQSRIAQVLRCVVGADLAKYSKAMETAERRLGAIGERTRQLERSVAELKAKQIDAQREKAILSNQLQTSARAARQFSAELTKKQEGFSADAAQRLQRQEQQLNRIQISFQNYNGLQEYRLQQTCRNTADAVHRGMGCLDFGHVLQVQEQKHAQLLKRLAGVERMVAIKVEPLLSCQARSSGFVKVRKALDAFEIDDFMSPLKALDLQFERISALGERINKLDALGSEVQERVREKKERAVQIKRAVQEYSQQSLQQIQTFEGFLPSTEHIGWRLTQIEQRQFQCVSVLRERQALTIKGLGYLVQQQVAAFPVPQTDALETRLFRLSEKTTSLAKALETGVPQHIKRLKQTKISSRAVLGLFSGFQRAIQLQMDLVQTQLQRVARISIRIATAERAVCTGSLRLAANKKTLGGVKRVVEDFAYAVNQDIEAPLSQRVCSLIEAAEKLDLSGEQLQAIPWLLQRIVDDGRCAFSRQLITIIKKNGCGIESDMLRIQRDLAQVTVRCGVVEVKMGRVMKQLGVAFVSMIPQGKKLVEQQVLRIRERNGIVQPGDDDQSKDPVGDAVQNTAKLAVYREQIQDQSLLLTLCEGVSVTLGSLEAKMKRLERKTDYSSIWNAAQQIAEIQQTEPAGYSALCAKIASLNARVDQVAVNVRLLGQKAPGGVAKSVKFARTAQNPPSRSQSRAAMSLVSAPVVPREDPSQVHQAEENKRVIQQLFSQLQRTSGVGLENGGRDLSRADLEPAFNPVQQSVLYQSTRRQMQQSGIAGEQTLSMSKYGVGRVDAFPEIPTVPILKQALNTLFNELLLNGFVLLQDIPRLQRLRQLAERIREPAFLVLIDPELKTATQLGKAWESYKYQCLEFLSKLYFRTDLATLFQQKTRRDRTALFDGDKPQNPYGLTLLYVYAMLLLRGFSFAAPGFEKQTTILLSPLMVNGPEQVEPVLTDAL